MKLSKLVGTLSSVAFCMSLLHTSCFANEAIKDNNKITMQTKTSANTNIANTANANASENNFEQKIHDYIMKNPKVIIESIQNLQQEKAKEEQEKVVAIKDNANKNKDLIFDTKALGHIVIGNANPKIIITEFFGYQCPMCRATSPAITEILQNNPEVQVILVPWTFEGRADVYAGQTAVALNHIDPSKFLTVHKTLLSLDGILQVEQIDKITQENGIDIEKLKQERNSQNVINGMKGNFELAKKLALFGTPTIFITNANKTKLEVIPGRTSTEELQSIINGVR